ncbi:MAG: cytochrome c oxidase subunit 3 family protein [Acidobacteriota bacterium]
MSSNHSGVVAHQFDDAVQQRETANLGMWAFLITEVMMFGGLFASYGYYRWKFHDAFVEGSNHLDYLLGATNTGVLICSSFTMALAVQAAQAGKRKSTIVFLLLTMVLGLAFLGIKAVEYTEKYEHHLIPGHGFQVASAHPNLVELFFAFYFTMTGLHALHMIIGLVVLSILVSMAWRNRFSTDYYSPVENAGIYWHFVDIVWIFLFPFLYLIGRS